MLEMFRKKQAITVYLRLNSLNLLLLIIPLYQRVQMTFYLICVVPLLPDLKGIYRFPKDNYSRINRIFKLIRAFRVTNVHLFYNYQHELPYFEGYESMYRQLWLWYDKIFHVLQIIRIIRKWWIIFDVYKSQVYHSSLHKDIKFFAQMHLMHLLGLTYFYLLLEKL